ncbi:MAG: NAD(+) synthase [Dehalococcoidia bacterium]|nr:NAD(+) synthase [Dehalococcoidia bacterium]
MNTEQTAEKLTAWIKEKVLAAGCKGCVLGLSGGIDSAVASVLCKRAFPDSTLGLVLPCHSAPEDEAHTLLLARKFSIPTHKVELDPLFDSLVKSLPDAGDCRLAVANLKARLRMLTMYYFANMLKYLVVGSSDRSEIAVGYFTKYGDGGSDIMPLGNLLKGQVRELAGFLGVPREIISKPPSPGLWTGQTAEGELGLSYAEIDRYLLTGEAPPEVKKRIEALIAGSSHKRCLPPIAEV